MMLGFKTASQLNTTRYTIATPTIFKFQVMSNCVYYRLTINT